MNPLRGLEELNLPRLARVRDVDKLESVFSTLIALLNADPEDIPIAALFLDSPNAISEKHQRDTERIESAAHDGGCCCNRLPDEQTASTATS